MQPSQFYFKSCSLLILFVDEYIPNNRNRSYNILRFDIINGIFFILSIVMEWYLEIKSQNNPFTCNATPLKSKTKKEKKKMWRKRIWVLLMFYIYDIVILSILINSTFNVISTRNTLCLRKMIFQKVDVISNRYWGNRILIMKT